MWTKTCATGREKSPSESVSRSRWWSTKYSKTSLQNSVLNCTIRALKEWAMCYSVDMQKMLTVIDSRGVRGVVAPAADLSRETLGNVLDLIELSSKKEARKTSARLRSCDRARSWMPLSSVRQKRV